MRGTLSGIKNALSSLPSVDELLRSPDGVGWVGTFPRRLVVQAIRTVLDARRSMLQKGSAPAVSPGALIEDIRKEIDTLASFSLRPVINATGIVIHTNLGRAVLSGPIQDNISAIGRGYSNLEYDLETGKRGKRHSHTKKLLSWITGAEDALIVNNNAAAVLLCLNTLAKGKDVIVSRGELVEIGGSFRVPDVMSASNAVLREVGTTNKTHLYDYERAITDNTGLLLKVHQSNFKIIGFSEDVGIQDLVALGKKQGIPVMYDLGSGCLVDLKPHGVYGEPSVQEIVKSGIDIVTFSGDKLLGGPQGGLIVGRQDLLEKIRKNPLARALRIDKLTIAAFEATLMEYLDEDRAKQNIPVLHLLLQKPEEIQSRAKRLEKGLKKFLKEADVQVIQDSSKAGGGSLPDTEFPTYAVSVKPFRMNTHILESRLRQGSRPVIARIKDDSLILDARTIGDDEIEIVVKTIAAVFSAE